MMNQNIAFSRTMSLLKNNMEVEAAIKLQRHLDETGVHRIYI
jgi:hypothetical protein